MYDMGSKLDSFLRKWCFLPCFVHAVLLISLKIMRKNYISRFILQWRNSHTVILFLPLRGGVIGGRLSTYKTVLDFEEWPGGALPRSRILRIPDLKFLSSVFWLVALLQSGREISAIVLTVVGDGWKDQYIYIYIWESNLDSFLRQKCFLFCFVHVVLLISLDIRRKNLHQ